MKLVMYALWAIWFAGAIGWNATGCGPDVIRRECLVAQIVNRAPDHVKKLGCFFVACGGGPSVVADLLAIVIQDRNPPAVDFRPAQP